MDLDNSWNYCRKCKIDDDKPRVHCVVCSASFHYKCVLPKVTVKATDEIVKSINFHFYCDSHRNLSVHKLLSTMDSLERKFKMCMKSMEEMSEELSTHKNNLNNFVYNKTASSVSQDSSHIVNENLASNTGSTTPTVLPEDEGAHSSSQQVRSRSSTPRFLTVPTTVPVSPTPLASPIYLSPLSPNAPITLTPATSNGELIAAIPQKTIFVTGLDVNTGTDVVKQYIQSRYDVSNVQGFHVHKMRVDASKGYSSFKIFLGRNELMFNNLLKRDFWPQGISAHEFFRRQPRINN